MSFAKIIIDQFINILYTWHHSINWFKCIFLMTLNFVHDTMHWQHIDLHVTLYTGAPHESNIVDHTGSDLYTSTSCWALHMDKMSPSSPWCSRSKWPLRRWLDGTVAQPDIWTIIDWHGIYQCQCWSMHGGCDHACMLLNLLFSRWELTCHDIKHACLRSGSATPSDLHRLGGWAIKLNNEILKSNCLTKKAPFCSRCAQLNK